MGQPGKPLSPSIRYPGEPPLAEVLDDPLVVLVMRRDGLCPDAVRRWLDRLARRLAAG